MAFIFASLFNKFVENTIQVFQEGFFLNTNYLCWKSLLNCFYIK